VAPAIPDRRVPDVGGAIAPDLIVLSVMFGGFQKGIKTGSLNHSPHRHLYLHRYSRPFTITPASIAPLTGDYAGGSLLPLLQAVALLNDRGLSRWVNRAGVLAGC
jgi:hypothetical protein